MKLMKMKCVMGSPLSCHGVTNSEAGWGYLCAGVCIHTHPCSVTNSEGGNRVLCAYTLIHARSLIQKAAIMQCVHARSSMLTQMAGETIEGEECV